MKQLDDLLSIWELHKENGETLSAEDLCVENPELLEEVRWHIRALEEVESRFGVDGIQVRTSAPGNHSRNAPLLNQEFQVLNRYQIEQHHASGGLGDVYVAIDPVLNRRVAIKFPRQSRLTPEQLSRFEREARITGQLDHPGIVAVHSLKISDDSQPCYVMRFVKGPTLQERTKEFHQRADTTNSSVRFLSTEFRELLQHFVALCNIVAYAHDQGVIHRDIKPSNVILGPFGQTYLMDWGLARADRLDSKHSHPEVVVSTTDAVQTVEECLNRDSLKGNASTKGPFSTKTGQVLGTPAFASPEQLQGLSDQIDHRSDVYSLGASLYYLLTGKLPVEISHSAEYFKRLTNAKESLLEFPSSVPRPLAAICRAATCVAPAVRYPTPLTLAAEVERYLAGEPVGVLRETWPTRMLRWLRKHPRIAVGTAVALVLATLFAVLASTLTASFNRQLAETNSELRSSNTALEKANEDALTAWQRAEANFETARGAVEEFLVKVTDHPGLNRDDFTDLQVELLSSAKPFYEALLAQQPGNAEVDLARGEAHHRLAEIDRVSGNNEAAQDGYLAALKVFGQLPQVTREATRARLAEAHCRNDYGLLLRQLGNATGAREQYLAALAALEPTIAKETANTKLIHVAAGTHINLSQVLKTLGEPEAAVEEVTQAIEIQQNLVDRGDNDTLLRDFLATGYKTRGVLHLEVGRLDKAEQDLQSSFALASVLLNEDPDNPDRLDLIAGLHNNLGLLKRAVGDLNAGREELKKAANKWQELTARFPAQFGFHSDLGNCLNNLAVTHSDAGQLEAAIETYGEALTVWRELVNRHPDQPALRSKLAITLGNLASELLEAGNWSKAGDCHREALAIHERFVRQYPENQSTRLQLAATLCNYGNYLQEEDPASALAWYDRAATELQTILDKHEGHTTANQFLRNTWLGRARAFRQLARYTEAADCFQLAAKLSEDFERQPLEQSANQCRTMAKEAAHFDEILAGTVEPTDVEERGDLAGHCFNRQMFLRAAQEFREAFMIDNDWPIEVWYAAARAAALVAAGKGMDTGSLTESERAQWREQCREWLNQALELQRGKLQAEGASTTTAMLGDWLRERDLAAVRDSVALSKLPASERKLWEEFWNKARDLAEN